MPTSSMTRRLRTSANVASTLTLSCVVLGSLTNSLPVCADETASVAQSAVKMDESEIGRVSVQKIAVEDQTDQLAKQAIAELGLDEANVIQQVSATSPVKSFSTRDALAPLMDAKGTAGNAEDHRLHPPIDDHPWVGHLGLPRLMPTTFGRMSAITVAS